jgi:hypothetical protein
MAETPVDIVRWLLGDRSNPALARVQFMAGTFATARSLRSGGTWAIQSDPDGSVVEV